MGADYGKLFVSFYPHQCGVGFLIAVELDGIAVVAHFVERLANGFLFLFRDGTTLLTDMVIGCFTEASHDFISDTAQVGCPHIVEDVRDAPCIFFPTVGYEERTRLLAVYHRRVGYGVGLVRVPVEHLLGGVVQASVCLLAMCSGAVGEAAVESVVFLLGHNILR